MAPTPGVAPAPSSAGPGTAGMAGGSPPAQSPGVGSAASVANRFGASAAPKSTPEQKARWREKWRRRRERAALAAGQPVALPPASPGTDAAAPGAESGGGVPGVGTPAPIPWDPSALRPMFEQLVPALEKADVNSLVAKAARLGDEKLTAEVARECAWPEVSKASVIVSGPQCLAEFLNSIGIGADKAYWVAFGIGVSTILGQRQLLSSKLDSLVARVEAARTKEATPA